MNRFWLLVLALIALLWLAIISPLPAKANGKTPFREADSTAYSDS